jgi:sodium transport system permease protein
MPSASLTIGSAQAEPIVEATDARRGTPPPSLRDTLREADNPVLAAARRALTSREVDAVLVIWPGFGTQLDARGLATVSIYFDSVREDSRLARERAVATLRTYREAVLDARERVAPMASPPPWTQARRGQASRAPALALGRC